jgi:hypothetical protein
MGDLLKILFGFGVGFGVAKAFSSDNDEIKNEDFFIYVRTEEASKVNMFFKDYLSAKNVLDKIKSSGKVKYQILLDNSESEKKHYNKMVEQKLGKKDGVSLPSDMLSVSEVYFGKGNEDWESKTFKN